jgi:hypothetical protein
VTERDQIAGSLRRKDSRQARRGQHVSLRDGIFFDQVEGGFLEADFTTRDRLAVLHWLG